MMNLTPRELELKPAWATHYFKDEPNHTLFESVDYWQWFIGDGFTEKYEQKYGINPSSILIKEKQ